MAWYPSIGVALAAVRPALRNLTWPLAAAAVQLTFTSGAWAIGPGFDCGGGLARGARIVCSNRDLSRTGLALTQAYYALRR
jgi:uncharacterized protein